MCISSDKHKVVDSVPVVEDMGNYELEDEDVLMPDAEVPIVDDPANYDPGLEPAPSSVPPEQQASSSRVTLDDPPPGSTSSSHFLGFRLLSVDPTSSATIRDEEIDKKTDEMMGMGINPPGVLRSPPPSTTAVPCTPVLRVWVPNQKIIQESGDYGTTIGHWSCWIRPSSVGADAHFVCPSAPEWEDFSFENLHGWVLPVASISSSFKPPHFPPSFAFGLTRACRFGFRLLASVGQWGQQPVSLGLPKPWRRIVRIVPTQRIPTRVDLQSTLQRPALQILLQ
ncbi:hypothetical protein C8R45DRAFT_946218 [Mycena sanguinolenta]|nr:hypothetical protein C8R45DRAFT_946218 [Mycena sanguinolenta]